jgi:hypothetical protein
MHNATAWDEAPMENWPTSESGGLLLLPESAESCVARLLLLLLGLAEQARAGVWGAKRRGRGRTKPTCVQPIHPT